MNGSGTVCLSQERGSCGLREKIEGVQFGEQGDLGYEFGRTEDEGAWGSGSRERGEKMMCPQEKEWSGERGRSQ